MLAMSERGLEALRAGREEVLAVVRTFSPEEWELPSDCDGWRVQDVVNHMANVFRNFVDPGANAPAIPGKTEATQDAQVDACRGWDRARVLQDYEDVSAKGLEAIAGFVTGPMADTVVPLDDLGMHPLHRLANALAFDHFCHLRNDILRPNGPIDREVPPPDELRLAAVLEWLLPGIPQMSPPALAEALSEPVGLRLTGPGGGEWTLRRAEGDEVEVDEASAGGGDAGRRAATIVSPASEFVVWATHRRPWRERDVTIEGDADAATRVLDAVHVF